MAEVDDFTGWCLRCNIAANGLGGIVPLGPILPAGLPAPMLQSVGLDKRVLNLGMNFVVELPTNPAAIALGLPDRADPVVGLAIHGGEAYLRLPPPRPRDDISYVRIRNGEISHVMPNGPRAFFRGWIFSVIDADEGRRRIIASYPPAE